MKLLLVEGIYTQQGTNELAAIFDGAANFKFPKPSALLRHLFQTFTGKDDLVLDSFAGSGTSGQAILSLNVEDGGTRRFVLVQMPYDNKDNESAKFNICRKVTAERVRRVSTGYSYSKKGRKGKKDLRTVEGIGGSFTYVRVGDPLFGEYKDFGDSLPPYEDIAKYVFYTETSREFPGTTKRQNPAWDKKAGRIGEHGGRSYYLLYEPNEREDRGLDRKFLKEVASQDPNGELVVYCERLAVHQDELRAFRREHGKRIRPMLVPFNLK